MENPRISAEAFTSFELTWDEHLKMLKEVANLNFIEGSNAFSLSSIYS